MTRHSRCGNWRPAALHTLAGHSSVVTAVAVTPDGRRAGSASWDNTLKVWELETGRELHTLAGHKLRGLGRPWP
jgi:WD40 repeat protein